jgi:hypothetical protein
LSKAEHDLFNRRKSEPKSEESRTIAEAVEQFLAAQSRENIVDMTHYEGLFERELLPGASA